ncbi:MAG: GNAT family N-acetyltransferase [Gemmatimonadales bacterium]
MPIPQGSPDAADVLIRPEVAADRDAVRSLLCAAFGGTTEAAIVDRLRAAEGSLSLVAAEQGAVVGQVLFTTASLGVAAPARVALLGPMAVAPPRQRGGIGSRLVAAGIAACREAGYQAVVVIGHAEYYPRFGFRSAASFGLTAPFEVPDEVFMAQELVHGGLAGGGQVRLAPAFLEP